MNTQEIEKEIEQQMAILTGYLVEFGIDVGTDPAQAIFTEIANGNIKTLKKTNVQLKSGEEIPKYTITLHEGHFEENASVLKTPTMKIETLVNLAVLGFEASPPWGGGHLSLPSAVFLGKGIGK